MGCLMGFHGDIMRYGAIWVCLRIGYTPNDDALSRFGVPYFQTNACSKIIPETDAVHPGFIIDK